MVDILKETIIPTKTFKEVHEDIDNEQLFLKKDHNIENFKEKATFLENVGFTNSIATKLYKAVADNHSVVQSYDMKYNGLYKFILEPQLERICEKYNLFVRRPELFLGDIPESNINDIRNFSVYAEDILDFENVPVRRVRNEFTNTFGNYLDSSGDVINPHSDWMARYDVKLRKFTNYDSFFTSFSDIKIPIEHLHHFGLGDCITIAAVEDLFDTRAFEVSRERIIGKTELQPKNQVDLDPIVLCQTKHGYIVVTAWGDEANDELVVNQKMN